MKSRRRKEAHKLVLYNGTRLALPLIYSLLLDEHLGTYWGSVELVQERVTRPLNVDITDEREKGKSKLKLFIDHHLVSHKL